LNVRQDAFQKQMILARSDVKRRWHLEVHRGSLKCVRVSLAPKAYRTVRGQRPRPEWGLSVIGVVTPNTSVSLGWARPGLYAAAMTSNCGRIELSSDVRLCVPQGLALLFLPSLGLGTRFAQAGHTSRSETVRLCFAAPAPSSRKLKWPH